MFSIVRYFTLYIYIYIPYHIYPFVSVNLLQPFQRVWDMQLCFLLQSWISFAHFHTWLWPILFYCFIFYFWVLFLIYIHVYRIWFDVYVWMIILRIYIKIFKGCHIWYRQVKVSSCVKYIKIGRLHQLHQIYKKTWHACCPLNAEIKWKLFYKFNKLWAI